jgi:hypothetical protein
MAAATHEHAVTAASGADNSRTRPRSEWSLRPMTPTKGRKAALRAATHPQSSELHRHLTHRLISRVMVPRSASSRGGATRALRYRRVLPRGRCYETQDRRVSGRLRAEESGTGDAPSNEGGVASGSLR